MNAKQQPPDALATLGTILERDEGRDAVHVAVIAAVAAHTLNPGDHAGYVNGEASVYSPKAIGIVDPFLMEKVRKGQWFWLWLYPRTITGLRHVWTHPAFPDEGEATCTESASATSTPTDARKRDSEAWLRDFAAMHDCPDYDTLIAAATGRHRLNDLGDGYSSSQNDGEYLHFNGSDAHGKIPPEFWDHVEVVGDRKIPQEERATWFSCSC